MLTRVFGRNRSHRALLADDRLASPLRSAFDGSFLYPSIGERVRQFAELFYSSKLQISLSLLNPAAFIHYALVTSSTSKHIEKFLGRVPPEAIGWYDTVMSLKAANPDVPIVLWAEEDAPFIWPRVLRKLAYLPEGTPLNGYHAPLIPLLEDEGLARLQDHLKNAPPPSDEAFEEVISDYLEKFGMVEKLSPRCEIPGWDDRIIADVTARYEEDLERLAQEDGIEVIAPTPL
ncbi:hypothetical protein [Celeribacter litoreus]|uniref:hypothetical protein n=1 Tax=Celeribacter litoreus TaxID=2876714 RepID=UPI001CCDD8A2|nr:hypothetical protein [Celeribacter litoreus]MCA0044522.1 hypothetical protein [Celeribacter litoreus]